MVSHDIYEDCPDCNGEGTVWGYEARMTNNSPWVSEWEMECPYCNGSGEIFIETIEEDPMNEVEFICFNMEQDKQEKSHETSHSLRDIRHRP
jgi:RecJ-like exonuclease